VSSDWSSKEFQVTGNRDRADTVAAIDQAAGDARNKATEWGAGLPPTLRTPNA